MGIFDEEDAEPGDSSTPPAGDDTSPGSGGDRPGDGSGAPGGDRVAELNRKLEDERKTNEELMARLARVEAMVASAGAPPKPAEDAAPKHTLESLLKHAETGGKEAFEAAVAFMRQEEGGFRERIIKEMRDNQAKEDARVELETLLPGASVAGSKMNRLVQAEAERILARKPSISPGAAWDLAVVTVAKSTPTAPKPDPGRRLQHAPGAGAARGGDADPGATPDFTFTKEDEARMRRMKPDSRLFSNDPKVRENARKAFVRIKKNLAERSQAVEFPRPEMQERG